MNDTLTPNTPIVSVIIPVLNGAAFIETALSSVLNQTLKSLEVIVVDDGSVDRTSEIVEAIAARDRRVQLIRKITCKGVSAARNTGLDAARGTYVALIDADDIWADNRLAYMISCIEAKGTDACADQQEKIEADSGYVLGNALRPSWMSSCQVISPGAFLLMDWPGRKDTLNIGIIKPVIRRDLIKRIGARYEESVSLGEDLLFYTTLLIGGMRLVLIPQPLYRYTIRTNSLSRHNMPTTQQVDVNRHITTELRRLGAKRADYETLRIILHTRERALWLQFLMWSLKDRYLGLLFYNIWRSGLQLPMLWLIDTVNRKLHRTPNDWDPSIVRKLSRLLYMEN